MNDATLTRSLLISLAALVALVLLTVFVIVPLLPTGQSQTAAAAPAPVAASTTQLAQADGEDEEDGAGDDEPVQETFEVFSARDPFHQLVQDRGAGGNTGTTGTSTGTDTGTSSGTNTGTTTGTNTGTNTSTDDDDDDTDPPASDASVGGTTIALLDVFTDTDGTQKVHVTVNQTGYEVAESEVFATRFQVLEIAGQCATFLFGDNRFVLCEGETIRK